MSRATVLVNACGCIYSMTSRQWLKFVQASAQGEAPEMPGRYLGPAQNVTDIGRRDFEMILDDLCTRCGAKMPTTLYAMIHKGTDAEVDKINDRCECGCPWVHTIRGARQRWKRKEHK